MIAAISSENPFDHLNPQKTRQSPNKMGTIVVIDRGLFQSDAIRTWWGSDKLSLIYNGGKKKLSAEGIDANTRDAFSGFACLVRDGLGVRPPLDGDSEGSRASPESCAGEAEGVHGGLMG